MGLRELSVAVPFLLLVTYVFHKLKFMKIILKLEVFAMKEIGQCRSRKDLKAIMSKEIHSLKSCYLDSKISFFDIIKIHI